MAKYINCKGTILNLDCIEAFECIWDDDSWAISLYFNHHKDRYVMRPFQSHEDAWAHLVNLLQNGIEGIITLKEYTLYRDLRYKEKE